LIEVGASRCLFGLAPAGVYPAASVTSRAVSSYLTFSPLPSLSTRRCIFCGTFRRPSASLRAPRRYLAAHPNGARTFLERCS